MRLTFRCCKRPVIPGLVLLGLIVLFTYHLRCNTERDELGSLHYLEALNAEIMTAYSNFNDYRSMIAKMARTFSNYTPVDKPVKAEVFVGTRARCTTAPFLLIEIHSQPEHFLSRQAIRLSWGDANLAINKIGNDIKRSYMVIFLLGTSQNQTTQRLVQMEARTSRDIVIGDFEDTYNNLYKKMLLGIQWPLNHCRAQYILKTDEDCYVNTALLIATLVIYHAVNGSTPLYMGRKNAATIVDRNAKSRYYMPTDVYPPSTFPPYISGGGYVFSGTLLADLYDASRSAALFPVEDACFGTLMTKLGVSPRDNLRFLPFIFCGLDSYNKYDKDPLDRPICDFLGPIIVHGLKPSRQIAMHFNVKLMTFAPSICQLTEIDSWLKSREECG